MHNLLHRRVLVYSDVELLNAAIQRSHGFASPQHPRRTCLAFLVLLVQLCCLLLDLLNGNHGSQGIYEVLSVDFGKGFVYRAASWNGLLVGKWNGSIVLTRCLFGRVLGVVFDSLC